MKKLLKSLVAVSMVMSSLTLMNVTAVSAHSVTEGQEITVATQVSQIQDIVDAEIKQYYEIDGKMRITKLQEDLFEIDEQTTNSPAHGPTNNCSSMYLLLDDNTATLIDGGNGEMNSHFSGEFIKLILDNIVQERELEIVLTHLHGDHVGLVTGDYSDIIPATTPVSIHEADFDALSPDVKENYNVSTYKGGDTLELSGYTFKIVDIPGHSDGSNAMIDYNKEVIIAGDAIGSGTVWLFSEMNLIEYSKGVDNLVAAVKDMNNPVIYCGHRWQQSYADAHTTGTVCVGEVGKQYVLEINQLIEDIADDNYSVNENYAAMPYPYYHAIYSEGSDLNNDGLIPGILAVREAVTTFKDYANAYPEGVTVVEDEQSASGYTAHFVYDAEADRERAGVPEGATITGVKISGSFRLHSGDSYEFDITREDHGHGLDEYQPGDFAANVYGGTWDGEWTFDMTLNKGTGNYELDVPMISGAHYYYITVNYDVADEKAEGGIKHASVSIDDPANPSPTRVNQANSDSYSDDYTHSIVYGKWCEKQGDTPNLDYMTPYTDVKEGTVEYREYKGNKNNHQDLAVYLPYGYDADREEPYKVIYMSHGAGGNEAYWMTQPQGKNVMDYMIANNPDQEAIVVSTDNTLYDWDYYQIADNVINKVIPFMEANYNVSKDADDRAYAGFSMGSMVTTYMAFNHADEFGYFGIFSGTNVTNFKYEEGFELDVSKFNSDPEYRQEAYDATVFSEELLNSVVFTQAGNFDTAVLANGWMPYMAYEMVRDVMAQNMPEGNFVDGGFVPGSHDIYTWGQCLYNFAKDICWSNEDEVVNPDTPVNPETPVVPDTPTVKDPVKTGDNAAITMYVVLGLCSAGAYVVMKRKREHA